MKVRHFIIIAVFLGVLALIYYPILGKKPEVSSAESKAVELYLPIYVAKNTERNQKIVSYGQVLPHHQLDIVMEVQGVIERDNPQLKVGRRFQKNETLIRLDRTDALYNLLSRRSAFINLVSNLLPDIALDHPNQREKWANYLNQINPIKALSPLPETHSQQEKLLIAARNIPTEYYALKALESQLEKYYYLAPFNGTVVESFVEPGSIVTPGMRIATITKTGEYEVKAPLNITYLEPIQQAKEITFYTPQNIELGKGRLLRLSEVINPQTQSIDAFFSIKPSSDLRIIQGMFVNLELETPLVESSVTLPDNAVLNSQVQLLKDSIVTSQTVTLVGSKPDSVFVTGIPDGAHVILEPLSSPDSNLKYIGIIK